MELCSPLLEKIAKCGVILYNCYDKALDKNHFLDNLPDTVFYAETMKIMKNVTLNDVGLDQCRWRGLCQKPTISYKYHIDCPRLSLVHFVLPKGTFVPLHDHPDMAVLTKLISGRIRIRSLDIFNSKMVYEKIKQEAPIPFELPYKEEIATPVRACVCEDRVVEEGETFCLTPKKGNLHYILALEDCAFLDMVLPNYDVGEKRDCSYFFEDEKSMTTSAKGQDTVIYYSMCPENISHQEIY